ncbi:MAG: glycosyltransferase family 2 protein [Clostridiales Family XIII bacterium]|nr:glycosyltransferase family 2 protein [Clostridiales Family XIII bacterium]
MQEHDSTIAIIMATFNGSQYLKEQLDSIINQTYSNWTLHITDDGSTDETLEIIKEYQKIYNNKIITLVKGPQKGFVENFLSLTDDNQIHADYYAFSDQDDIWFPTKLSHSLNIISQYDQNIPTLYGSRSIIVDKFNTQKGISIFTNVNSPNFSNSLIQNFSSGNTMLFNNPARDLIRVGHNLNPFAHDWWAYLMVTGSGGRIHNDPEPTVRYRQHSDNLIGFKKMSLWQRLNRFFYGCHKQQISQNMNALSHCSNLLSEYNYEIYKEFLKFRDGSDVINGLKFIKKYNLRELQCNGRRKLYIKYLLRRF